MPEDTAVTTAPDTTATTSAAEAAEPQVQDVELTINVGGVPLTVIETEKKKGKHKGEVAYYVKVDLTLEEPFADIRRAVGAENFNRCVMAMVRSACNDATADAMKDGEVSDVDWANMFREQFVGGNRRSGTGVKELREKQVELFGQLNPMLLRQAHGEKLTPEEQNRLLSLLADYSELNEKIESRRKGKGKGKKAKEAAAAKAAETPEAAPANAA